VDLGRINERVATVNSKIALLDGRGFHSSTSQLNLSRVFSEIPEYTQRTHRKCSRQAE